MALVNPATGEVTQTIADKEYKFKASMMRMAEYQSRLAVPGLGMVTMMIRGMDPRAIFFGLKCLCTSGNEADFDDMLLTSHMKEAQEALTEALNAGLPKAEKPGKGKATKVK